jgi:NarL family two-component system response regulator YdfI
MARVLSQANAPKTESHEHVNLTDRELEVLTCVARGERSKEIAAQLGISERTVKAHLASIYNKLGVDSRAAAVATAIQRGLLTK